MRRDGALPVDFPGNRCTEHLARLHGRSAWLSFEDNDRGHLRPGARADFAVLEQDYFAVPGEGIPSISAALTVVGGVTVHSSGTIAEPASDATRLLEPR